MKGKRKVIRGGQPEVDFIGFNCDPALKQRLRVLASLRRQTLTDVMTQLAEEATASLASVVDGASKQLRA